MTRAHNIIEGIISEEEKETYFEMSENCNEVFDIMQKTDKPEVIMNVVRNFGKKRKRTVSRKRHKRYD